MNRKFLIQLGLGAIFGAAVVILGVFVFAKPYTFQGSVIDPPASVADFALEATDGSTFRLSEQRGNVVLLFFGYTHCPDVCPTTLYDFKQIVQGLDEDAERVQFAFVTVDPERDSLDHLAAYVSAFDEQIVGLSGAQKTLDEVYANFGVFYEKKDVGSAAGYLVDHTARVYVIDAQGNLSLTFPFGMESAAMTDDIAHLLGEG